MDTTRYAKTSKPRPCLPSLQRSRTRVAAPGRARAVSLDEVSDRSLSRDDLVWETRMCLRPSTAPSIDDLGFDEEDAYDEGEVEGSFENNRKALEDDGEDIFPQDESVKGVEALVLTEAPAVVTPPVTPRSLPQPLSLSGAKYLATRVLGFAGRELGSVVYSLSACCSMQCRNQPTSRRWRGALEI